MKFSIQIVDVEVTTAPTSNGKTYEKAVITHKNMGSGKTEAKTLVGFKNAEVFKTLIKASKGDCFDITAEKGEQYWEWVNCVVMGTPDHQQATQQANAAPAQAGNQKKFNDDYDTKQLMITRQSSLKTAAIWNAGCNLQELLETAEALVQFVYHGNVKTGIDGLAKDPMERVMDNDDEIPF